MNAARRAANDGTASASPPQTGASISQIAKRGHDLTSVSCSFDSLSESSDENDDDGAYAFEAGSPVLDLDAVSTESLMAPTSEFGRSYADSATASDPFARMSLSPPRAGDASPYSATPSPRREHAVDDTPLQLRPRLRDRHEARSSRRQQQQGGWATQLRLDEADDDSDSDSEVVDTGLHGKRGRAFVSHVREQQQRRRQFEMWCNDILRQFGGSSRTASPAASPVAPTAAAEAVEDAPTAKRVHMCEHDAAAEVVPMPLLG